MDLTAWAFYALISLAALAAALLHYRRREPPGRGRSILALLRGLTISVVVLLLFDPLMPAGRGAAGGGARVLLDASLSMRLPDEDGVSRWDRARAMAHAEAGEAPVLLFGAGETTPVGAADTIAPTGTDSRLAPALRAAAEAGASRVVVFTDAGLVDLREARDVARLAGLELDIRSVGGTPAFNAGIVEVRAPAWARVGEEVAVGVGVAATRGGDTVTVVLRRDGRELARATVPAAVPGRVGTATLRFTPGAGSGGADAGEQIRLEAALLGADAESDDDVRPFHMHVSDDPAGVVLVTLSPDQEPRFLLPVLERSLGVPTQGWLALPGGRYIRLGLGADAGLPGQESAVRAAVRDADMVVLHGVDDEAPAWVREVAASAGRLLLFPAGPVEGLPVSLGAERPGDWYVAGDVPPSPLAPLLVGVEPGDAPPLTTLRPATTAPADFWGPLDARLGRRGAAHPVLVAGPARGRRIAVATGEGYWRWAFAGGGSRDVYERLWSAVGAWLMEEDVVVSAQRVRPAERVVERGAAVAWLAPPGTDSLRVVARPLRRAGAAGEAGGAEGGEEPLAAVDTVVGVDGGRATTSPLPPGMYAYEAAALTVDDDGGASGEAGRGEGELTVESYSPEFTRPAVSLEERGGTAGRDGAAEVVEASLRRQGRPLHTSPWPYLVVIALLSAEWILRRRWGLR